MPELEILQRRIERERTARLEAENILEEKSLELHEATLEAQRAAEQLNDQNRKIRAILDYAIEGILTVDRDCVITTANPAAAKIFGNESSDLLGRSLSDFVSEFTDESCRVILDSEDGIREAEEYVGRRADGSEFVLEMTISSIEDDAAETMVVFIRDRTKRKNMASQLALSPRMESVGQLAAGIAHEINTPIQYVGDNAKFLQDAFGDIQELLEMYDWLSNWLANSLTASDSTRQLVDQIENHKESVDLEFIRDEVPQAIAQTISGADRVASIVRAMKEFSHPGSEQQSAFDVNHALESTITVSRNEWKYVAKVETDFCTTLPPCFGYPGDLNQAFLNMIVNAAHAIEHRTTEDKEHEGIIRVSTAQEPDWIVIRISDTGCGIDPENINRIYDQFFTTKPVGKGTGQGLALTHGVIVEKHGGRLDVESKVGVGTTFTIRIPRQDESPMKTDKVEGANV